MSRLLVLGAGGHGRVIAESAIASGQWDEIAFLDGRYPELSRALGWPVIGGDADPAQFLSDYPDSIVAIGDNRLRVLLVVGLLKLGFHIPAVVHPSAWVSPSTRIGAGTVVMAGAVVSAEAALGIACIVNTGATVDHDCELADGVHVSPGAHIGGETVIGERSWIGIGAAVRHCVRIGADVMVGAGAAVVADLPAGVTAVGVPARIV